MSEPRVTITLGRSGQVVKRPRDVFDRSPADSDPLSGSKRVRGDAITRSLRSDRVGDARVGRNDLRLKLMRKRMFRRIQHEVEEHKSDDHRNKASRTIQPPLDPQRNFLRHVPPPKRKPELMPVDPLRRSYSSRASPDRVMMTSRGISPTRSEEVHLVTLARPVVTSRTGQILSSNTSEASRLKGPAPITRATFSSGKPTTEFPQVGGSIPRSSHAADESLTVGSLLSSLGLGKYTVQFRAEEVDMAALKQMGDHDLKEMGLPMGPRKKILLAVKSLSKRQPSQLQA